MRRCVIRLLLVSLPALACSQTPTEFRPLPAALGDARGVALGFERLQVLGDGEGTYAAWINMEQGETVPLGGFEIDENGRTIDEDGAPVERFEADRGLFSATSIFITIEPVEVGATPGGAVILQGPFIDGVARLGVPAPAGTSGAAGSYRVFTPTDGPNSNEGSGLWAISDAGEPLLAFPSTNNVFIFEQFLFLDGTPLAMGRFNVTNAADTGNPFSGNQPAPAVPGEDFLVNAPDGLAFPADLSGARLIISLEARIDDLAGPSQLVALEAILPAGLQGGETITLTNQAALFPAGVAVVF